MDVQEKIENYIGDLEDFDYTPAELEAFVLQLDL